MAELYGANIASTQPGLGAGQAQIFDTTRVEKQLQDEIERERRRRDLEAKAIADQLANVKLDGIRSVDTKSATSKYNETYQKFRDLKAATLTNDRNKIATAQAELDKSKSSLVSFISQSKAENARLSPVGLEILKNPRAFSRDASKVWTDINNTPTDDPNYVNKTDLSKLQRPEPKVDLNETFTKLAKDSVIPGKPGVTIVGKFNFDQKTDNLDYPTLSKRIELEYTRDPDIADRIDQVYDPKSFDPQRKAELEKLTGKSLNTPTELASADAYDTNRKFLNKSDRKQLTEKTPRASGSTINLSLPGNGDNQSTQIYTTTPSAKGGTYNGVATAVGAFQFPTIKFSTSSSPDLKDASTGQSITKPGAYDLYGSQITNVPVFKPGTKKSGKDVSGLIVPDNERDDALKNGTASYKMMFHAQHGQVIGFSKDGRGNDVYELSKDATPVYAPASNSVIQVLMQKTTKANQPAVAAKISELYTQNRQLNSQLKSIPTQKPQNNSVPSPKIKIDPKKRLW